MSEITDRIKERLGVAEVVGDYLRLEKAGSNYKALCPFHNEKTPSFMVNAEKNFWYCFGCQKGGDIFTFVQEMEGLDFRETLERLAERAGVELPRYDSGAYREQKSKKQKVLEILELAARAFQQNLEKHPAGILSRRYLHSRGIDDASIKEFRLGYAPNSWEAMLVFLQSRGYTVQDIALSGLLVEKDGGGFYDRFRGRITFPIIDVVGRVVGFSARVAPGGDESSAKYINTPQTMVYDKSLVLYGLFQAKTEIKKRDSVIVVEGNADVVLSHRAGVKNVIAISGTALSIEQVRIIKRYTGNIKLCLDMDEAGQRATGRSIQTCLSGGMEAEVILLPSGVKDVGDLAGADPKRWQEVSLISLPVMDYFFQLASKRYDLSRVKDKKLMARDLLNVIKSIADPIEQNYYLKKLSARLSVEEDILTRVLEKVRLEKDGPSPHMERPDESASRLKNKPRTQLLQERLIGLLFLFPEVLKAKAGELSGKGILSADLDKVLADFLATGGTEYRDLLNQLATEAHYSFDQQMGFLENQLDPDREWDFCLGEILEEGKKVRRRSLILDIRRAEEAGDDEAAELLLGELEKLSR